MQVVKRIKELGGDVVIYGISGVLLKLIGIFLVPVYTRVFDPAEYGVVTLITATIGLLSMFSALGLDNSAARWYYDSDCPGDRRTTIASWFWCQFAANIAAAIALLAFASPVSTVVCGTADYASVIRIAALSLPLTSAAMVVHKWFRFRRQPIAAVSFGIGNTLAVLSLVILFVAIWEWGIGGVFTAKLVASGITAIVALFLIRRAIPLQSFSGARLKEMLRYGMPLIPTAIAFWVMVSSDRFMLRILADKDEVGLYAVAAAVASGVTLVTSSFAQAWGPFAFSLIGKQEAHRVYSRTFELYSYIACGFFAAVALFAPVLLRILTTEPYFAAASCVSILAFAQVLEGARFIAGLGPGIAKRSAPVAVSIGIGATVNILMNLLLIPALGRDGAAIGMVVANLSAVAYLFASSHKLYPIPYRWSTSLLCVGASWGVVFIAWRWIPEVGAVPMILRASLLLVYVPLGVGCGLIKRRYLKQLLERRSVVEPAAAR